MEAQDRDPITQKIIGCCYEVHKELVPGFLDKIYSKALMIQFEKENISFECGKEFNVYFKDKLAGKFRCDFSIEDNLIL